MSQRPVKVQLKRVSWGYLSEGRETRMERADREAAAAFFDKLIEKAEKSIRAAEARRDMTAVVNLKNKLKYYQTAAEELKQNKN